jgi:hypothetical protein
MKRWKEIQGYNEQHQYVNAEGRIIGQVDGSRYNDNGFSAIAETPDVVQLGRYESVSEAKFAVETYCSNLEAENV